MTGWRLEDAEALAAAHPDTFRIAPRETLATLRLADYAKLMIVFPSNGVEVIERMWTVISRNDDGRYLGRLVNEPAKAPDDPTLRYGCELAYEARHVIDWREADDRSRAYLADLDAGASPL